MTRGTRGNPGLYYKQQQQKVNSLNSRWKFAQPLQSAHPTPRANSPNPTSKLIQPQHGTHPIHCISIFQFGNPPKRYCKFAYSSGFGAFFIVSSQMSNELGPGHNCKVMAAVHQSMKIYTKYEYVIWIR